MTARRSESSGRHSCDRGTPRFPDNNPLSALSNLPRPIDRCSWAISRLIAFPHDSQALERDRWLVRLEDVRFRNDERRETSCCNARHAATKLVRHSRHQALDHPKVSEEEA